MDVTRAQPNVMHVKPLMLFWCIFIKHICHYAYLKTSLARSFRSDEWTVDTRQKAFMPLLQHKPEGAAECVFAKPPVNKE